jgi:thioredoxin-like negative regulator of GroEL
MIVFAAAQVLAIGALIGVPRPAFAQSLGELNSRLNEIASQVDAGENNPQAASDAIDRMDASEVDFARLAEGSRVNREALLETFGRLEALLNRLYTTYQRRTDACITSLDRGGSCDYDQPEQLALRALYPLSWLRFEAAGLNGDEPSVARRLLNQAIDGFTESSLVILSPELVRENLLGRAFSERELGKYEHSEYSHAVTDFKRIIEDGPGTGQYRAAEQGLTMTYAAMGKMNDAQGMAGRLAAGATGSDRNGLEMLRLREMFQAESATRDAAKRAEQHKQIVDFIRDRESDKDGWAVAIAAAAQYVSDPVAEFGAADDPFQNWLLANILYYKHQPLAAANYYWAAARSGKYPKAWKYAADLYYAGGRLDQVEKVVTDLAREPRNPDAQWASYMRFKIPRLEWERGGMRNASLERAWVAGANDYLAAYPRGQWAYEPRLRLGDLMERRGDYLGAAKQYAQVKGNPDYEFTARYNAAESDYRALTAKAPDGGGAANKGAIREDTLRNLRDAIRLEPAAELAAPASQGRALHDSRGRAVYLLVTLREADPQIDYREIASLLDNYEAQYPAMGAHFDQTSEWRLEALDRIHDFAHLEREANALVAGDPPPNRYDYLKEIGISFWKSGAARLAAGDDAGYLEDAKLTSIIYGYFERMVNAGRIPAKNLTGTLSILGQSYIALGDADKADAIFDQVVKADPASPDANAGLARIAQSRRNYRDALDLWSRVESVAAESDPVFYEAKYHMAEIFAEEGNVTGACNKLAVTRSEHPGLGSPGMKAQWGTLEHKLCQDRKTS